MQVETKPSAARNRLQELRGVIEHAAHLLPAQGPITVFVHHNTLHAFEHLPFAGALSEGSQTFGCHPYLSCERYLQEMAKGRITAADVDVVLQEDLGDRADVLLGFLGTRFHLRRAMLDRPWRLAPGRELEWVVAETDALRRMDGDVPPTVRSQLIQATRDSVSRGAPAASGSGSGATVWSRLRDSFDYSRSPHWSESEWEALTLHAMWSACLDGVRRSDAPVPSRHGWIRHRDWLLEACGDDSDRLVHDLLIRFCAAFLDQGMAEWRLPDRERGFWAAFWSTYGPRSSVVDRWLLPLRQEWARHRRERTSPLASIEESLRLLGVTRDEEEPFLSQTLLALRGWAGMLWQVESRADRVARPVPADSLIEYLAVRLILERLALAEIAGQALRLHIPLCRLREALRSRIPGRPADRLDQRAFVIFQLAQSLGWDAETLQQLSSSEWGTLLREVESFSALEQRRVFQLAYERHFRNRALSAIGTHPDSTGERCAAEADGKTPTGPANDGPTIRPAFQLVTCIDDREESFRRHVEEIAPNCQTFGTAGFFAVAMYYRGVAEAQFMPLCPVVMRPRHYVRESVAYSLQRVERVRSQTRRAIGRFTQGIHVGSRTILGGWITAVFGAMASIPLVMRILFPRTTSQWRRWIGSIVRPARFTQLQLQRVQDPPGNAGDQLGYSLDEMADIVARLLVDIGLTRHFAPLVFIVGHGSSSMNNPHESAYNCGACAGARGGPNARAFAQMANHPRVRDRLAARGIEVPDDVTFVGCYHNTCDDAIEYFDLDRLPESQRSRFEQVNEVMDRARERNAQERCRRFESASLSLTPEAALRHVETRAEDLSQPRPEYNHATNAMCLVGRRDWSRGLFLDRRAFLQSYDPCHDDDEGSVLTRILQAVIPVCAGISLEYYFSCVDPVGFGAGNKLPHNIVSLLGVMDGAASDLRTGLYQQMTEIHEPMRLLFVIEATPTTLLRIMDRVEVIGRLCRGGWVQLVAFQPQTRQMQIFVNGAFIPHVPETTALPRVASSRDWYQGQRDHLEFACIDPSEPPVPRDSVGSKSVLRWGVTNRSQSRERTSDA